MSVDIRCKLLYKSPQIVANGGSNKVTAKINEVSRLIQEMVANEVGFYSMAA